jgi:hypothetical protein
MDDQVKAALKLVATKAEGVLVAGQVAESKVTAAGQMNGRSWDAAGSVRIVTGLGMSVTVKLPLSGGLPKVGDHHVVYVNRIWKGQNGLAAEADTFI